LPGGFEVPFTCTAEYLDMKYLGSIYHSTQKDIPNPRDIEIFKRKLFGE